ncbi:MAG: hypothetical protein LBT54_01015, partial [Bifidobacteriaceae bacterium]|nr:hypothetical protein [Bifidobacteriaceae bacterium]
MSNPNGSGAVRARRWPALVAVAVTASFAVAGLQAPGLPGGAQPAGAAVPPYQDTALPAEVRAADLVSRMTLGQKFEQLRAA